MTKGNKRLRKKENRIKNAEIDKRAGEGDAAKETSTVKRGSIYISYLKKDELQEIRILLNINVLDDSDLLQGAVAIGNFSVVKRLLKHGCQINCCGKNGLTCLMWAVKCKRLEMVDLLIKRSADITAANTEGDNAMLLAIQSDCWHQDAFLDLWNTISRFSSSFKEVVNHANKKGDTLLHLSVKRKWENIVDRLIDDGANVNCINHRGITPLMIAGFGGDVTLIRSLLRSKANVLLEDKRGCTAVCYAIAFMSPKHAEVSHTLNDKLAEEFSIFTPMMVSEEIYLKRRLDLLVYPPSEDFPSTIRKVIVPLMTFFVRFNKDGLLLLLELQVFGRIQEAVERHIEDIEYLKALMSVTLELVRDCQCCIHEFLPAEVGKSFVGAGLPEACLRILKKHNQTSMKESVIKAALLPLISVCTSRGTSGKIWLQNNFKNLTPFYQKCNISKDKTFKILADDLHKNLLKQSVKDFGKLLKNLESGKLIVQNMESFKMEESQLKNGSDGNCSTVSNSRSVSPSFIDFLSEKCSPENKLTHKNEPTISMKHEELKQSQHNHVKTSTTTEGYTNLTELFMSRKNSDNNKTQLLQKPAIKSCLDEGVENLKTECKNGGKIEMKIDINSSNNLISDRQVLKSRIEDGKTFSSVLQQKIKIETYPKSLITNFNRNVSSGVFMENIPEKLSDNLETPTIDTKLSEINEPGPNSTKLVEDLKTDLYSGTNCVKDVEGRYKNPISNFLWSLNVDDSNPLTERSNIPKFEGKLETNLPVFEDQYTFDWYVHDKANHESKIESKVKTEDESEAETRVEFESASKFQVYYYNEGNPILSQGKSQFESGLSDNFHNNYLRNDDEEYENKANNYSKIYYNHEKNQNPTNQICEENLSLKSKRSIIKDNYDINYSDDDKIRAYNKNNDKICDVPDDNSLLNYQYQKYEAEIMDCDYIDGKHILDSDFSAIEKNDFNNNITKNLKEDYCVVYNENSKPDIIVEHEFSTTANSETKKKKKECSSSELDSQIEKLDIQVKHIINQYETLCRKDFENGYPKAQVDEARLLELMTSLPLVELSHLQNLKQKWNELRDKLTTENKQNLDEVVKKVEKYLVSFSKSLDKKIDACRIEPQLSDIGEDLKYSSFYYDENFETNGDKFLINNDKSIIQIDDKQYAYENYNYIEHNYWHTAYNEQLNFSKNYEENENHDEAFDNDYSRFQQTEFIEQPRKFSKHEVIYGKGDFNRIPHPEYISEFNKKFENKFVREDYERLLNEDRKSMYCSQNYLDLIIDLMNLNEEKKEMFGNGSIVLASSTYPEYKLKDGGNFGTVVLGMDQDGYPLAVKRIIRCKTKTMQMITSTLRSLLYEMSDLHHPNIVPYVNYVETEFNVMIALPLCEKNLDEYIKELKECNDLGNRSVDLVLQMMKGLNYLHSCTPPIIHGNLKPTNILIDSKQTVRLADFGLHKVLFKQKSPLVDEMIWWAQETYLTYKNTLKMVCTLQSDIQVAGILMHYILTAGIHPFGRPNTILMEDPSVLSPTLHTTNCEANDLLTWMLEDVNNRPSIDQALSHIFFWSDERKWEFILACSGVDSNYKESQLPLKEFFNFISQRTLKEKSEGNWGTIIQQNFPDHYATASKCCDAKTVCGLLMFINLSILNKETEFRSRFRRVIAFAYPNLPLGLFRFIENSEWETHSELIKYSHHSLY